MKSFDEILKEFESFFAMDDSKMKQTAKEGESFGKIKGKDI